MSSRISYEESILVTVLGENYHQFISQETGDWENEEQVVATF